MMRTETLIVLAVAAGSALGGLARYGLSGLVARSFGETFPWGTLVVNVTGSLVIGFLATLTGPDGRLLVSPVTRQLWMPGILGGFTTFSSFKPADAERWRSWTPRPRCAGCSTRSSP